MPFRVTGRLKEASGLLVRTLHIVDSACVVLLLWVLCEIKTLPEWNYYWASLAMVTFVLSLICFHAFQLYRPWQVSMRSETVNYQDRVDLDTWYVMNHSAWLYFKIILKTVWVVFSGRGAY